MRRLLVLVCMAAVLWAGYWFIGSRSVEAGLELWLKDRRAEGWVADTSDVAVKGFPNRFDATITDLNLADPNTGLAWSAPFFQILALSYKPNHVIAVWPPQQVLATPDGKITIASERMQGSVVFRPDTNLTLDRATIVLEALKLNAEAGWHAEFPTARLASRTIEGYESTYQIGFDASQMVLSDDLLKLIGQTGLPNVFESLRFDAEITFDAPWDRFAVERRRPQPRAINLSMLRAEWGQLELQAAGDLEIDASGTPTGDISVRATNWREMIKIGVAAGAIPAEISDTLESGLSLVAGLSGNKDTLDLPLSFRNGRVALGPVPLGPAPLIFIR